MISVFNLEQLESLLKDFYFITKIRITIFDSHYNELISYPDHRPPHCSLIRSTENGRRSCIKCDEDACEIASFQKKPYIYQCHAGLTETIIPLHVGDVLVGYLLFGHVFAYESFENGWKILQKCCENYGIDEHLLKEALKKTPCISHEYIDSAARILHATASYLVLERMATLQEESAATRLNTYINAHFTEPITTEQLCDLLGIGRSKLYKLAHELYGCGISSQIRKLQMRLAKKLLLDQPDMNITEIAHACGFNDYNYFISVFSKTYGKPPKAMRKDTSYLIM